MRRVYPLFSWDGQADLLGPAQMMQYAHLVSWGPVIAVTIPVAFVWVCVRE